MHTLVFLKSLVIILGISAAVVFLLHRIRVPSIVGFLLAGMLLGPYGFHLLEETETIQTFAEIGVILLLFTIGLEFSLSKFLRMRLEVFGIGGLYVLITIALTTLVAYQWLNSLDTAIFIGFLVALSSTAIVMKLLSERAELDTLHGRFSLGILIFQDLCVVPFMLFIPIMSGEGGVIELIITFGKALAIVAIVLFSARWIVPKLLHQIVHTRSRELFVITILILCFGIAFITSEFGLSLALGAFLAGLVISESEYVHEATSAILPFKDSFNGLFFISVGMLMDTTFFINNLQLVATFVITIFLIKFISGFLSMYLMKRPLRTSIHTSMNLAQVGEFSFVLAVAGVSAGVISNNVYQEFLSASVLTMLFTPFIIQFSPFLSDRLSSYKLLQPLERNKELLSTEVSTETLKDHVIIIGFGLNGRNLARVLKEINIPYVILELNIETVREMRKQGEPIYYGDGTKIDALRRLGVKTAKILVVVISDAASCRQIVQAARKENPKLFIIARTRYVVEVEDLFRLGADSVIPEEFETSIEIFSRVLEHYKVPGKVISDFVDTIRRDGYKLLRQREIPIRRYLPEEYAILSTLNIEKITIPADSPVVGKSLKELAFRTKTGATIIAVERNGQTQISVAPDFSFQPGDTVFVTGSEEGIKKATTYLIRGNI
jgi:CPA2 family monovalent cation:H+ antiporter-2